MLQKFNADRRDKIPKQKHRVTNWAEYNESLRQRGELTVWISEEGARFVVGTAQDEAGWTACLFRSDD